MCTILTEYLNYHKYKGFSPFTISGYSSDIRQFITHYEKKSGYQVDFNLITQQDLERFLRSLNLTAKTVHRNVSSLKSFFKYLVRDQIILFNPAAEIEFPKTRESLPIFLSVDQVLKLLNYPKPLLQRTIVEVLYSTGCRLSELTHMFCDKVTIEYDENHMPVKGEVLLVETKGGRSRSVPLSPRAAKTLDVYMNRFLSQEEIKDKGIYARNRSRAERLRDFKDRDLFLPPDQLKYVFLSSDYPRRVANRTVQHYVSSNAKRSGIGHCSPHQLRHSLGTHLTMQGINMRVLQEILGHKDLNVTQLYSTLTPDHIRAEYDDKLLIK